MPARHARIGAVGLIALTLLVSGCGAHTATRADVVARADAICASTLAALRAQQPGAGAVAGAVPRIAQEVRSLEALPRPAAGRSLLDRYLAAMSASLVDWRQLAAAQRAHAGAATTAAETALASNPAPALAARYGLRTCASAGATVGSVSGGS